MFTETYIIKKCYSSFCSKMSARQKCPLTALAYLKQGLPPPGIFERQLKKLYQSDSIKGPEMVGKYLRTLAYRLPSGKDRRFLLNQADNARNDAYVMKRLKKGWEQYNMTPWEVVHHKTIHPLPRYNSEPLLNSAY